MGLLEKSSNTTGEERGTLNKSVLVAALSVALISTGLAEPDRSSTKNFSRGHRNTESGSSAGKATIIGANINVRSAPDSKSSLVTKVTGGVAKILGQKGDWYKLKFQYGTQGWVRQDFLKIAGKSAAKVIPIKLDPMPVVVTKTSDSPKAKVMNASSEGLTRYVMLSNKAVNIHRGPSASNTILGKVKGGKALVLDRAGDFYKLKFKYGSTGWVKSTACVFPTNFDFKNGKNRPQTMVATKTAPKTKPIEAINRGNIPENSVEIVGTGERTTIPTEETTETNANNNTSPLMATVVGDGITVRKGPSTTNSSMMKVNGGRAQIIDHRGDFYQLRFEHGTIGWVHENYVSYPGHIVAEAPKLPEVENDPNISAVLIKNARTFTGVRYVWAGSSRSGTDCSGFTLQVFKSVGIKLPRTSGEQCKRGTRVSRAQLQTGDLVFFNTRGSGVSHVGIYIGNSRFIHASSGAGHVTESSLNDTYYNKRFMYGSRLIPASKVKILDLPKPGEIPPEVQGDRDDNTVDISKSSPGSGRD